MSKTDLQAKQLRTVNALIAEIGDISNEEALALLADDEDEFKKYLYYTSAKHIKRISEPKNKRLKDILFMVDKEKQVKAFREYLADDEELEKFLRIFPIVITTVISAQKLGSPKQFFNIMIMDEASQCNTAEALIPIIRTENLMLVGDPQQLNPVITLDPQMNKELIRKYCVSKTYDYITNSIYKVFIEKDPLGEEILLSYHYRCDEKIITFNNKKYYNGKLKIKSAKKHGNSLKFVDIEGNESAGRNTSYSEAKEIIDFIKAHPEEKIGVITPFVKQKDYIKELLQQNELPDIPCGTVHTFQGDEKDVILFSLALTNETSKKTYEWLKNNRELINVATSRPKDKLVIFGSSQEIKRLNNPEEKDDLYDLCKYVSTNGSSEVRSNTLGSKALGFKPYTTETEQYFLTNLNHALGTGFAGETTFVAKEVPIKHVFRDDDPGIDLFYTGTFDFVIYRKDTNRPIPAIELDGPEHKDDEKVKIRDAKKQAICDKYAFKLLRIENSYARRYTFIKQLLMSHFDKRRV